MPAQLTLRNPKGGRVLAERTYADGYRIDATSGWLVVVDRNGSVIAAHAACPGLEGRIVEHASAAAPYPAGETATYPTSDGIALDGDGEDPPLRVADVRDDGDRFAEELLLDLRRLGDTYGPLGVAIAAATLTDPRVLVASIDPDAPEPEHPVPAEQPEPVDLYVPVAARVTWDGTRLRALYLYPHDGTVGTEAYLDGKGRPLTIEDVRAERSGEEPFAHEAPVDETAREQVGRLADWIMERWAGEPSRSEGAVDTAIRLLAEADETVQMYRREVEEQTARAEREHAMRLSSEQTNMHLREKLRAAEQRIARAEREADALRAERDEQLGDAQGRIAHLTAERTRLTRRVDELQDAPALPSFPRPVDGSVSVEFGKDGQRVDSIEAPRLLDLGQHPLALRAYAPGLVTFDGRVLRVEYGSVQPGDQLAEAREEADAEHWRAEQEVQRGNGALATIDRLREFVANLAAEDWTAHADDHQWILQRPARIASSIEDLVLGERVPADLPRGALLDRVPHEPIDLRPVEEDPRRPHPDAWPDDAVLLTYGELRRLVALHLDRYHADDGAARAMLDGDVPLRVSEVLA
jgi:hypothetical protein